MPAFHGRIPNKANTTQGYIPRALYSSEIYFVVKRWVVYKNSLPVYD